MDTSTKVRKPSKSKPEGDFVRTKEEELECAVCLQPCIHPVRLPCSHIFCFLCVKGVANQSKRCAMCRQDIPADYLDHPDLLKDVEEKDLESEGYQWFYEGRNGWWQYDERTTAELEAAYGGGQRVCEVLVAGFLYTVDFDKMVQQRRNDPSRRRRIKRDMASIPKKGIAGLKTSIESSSQVDSMQCVDSVDAELDPAVEPSISERIHALSSTVDTSNSSSVSRTSSQSSNEISSSERPNSSSEPSELTHVHLLHSNTFGNFHPLRRHNQLANRHLNHPNIPQLRRRVGRSRNQSAYQLRTQSPVISLNADDSSPETISEDAAPSSCPEGEQTLDTLTTTLADISVSTDLQYYSLDETEEYRLPEDDEL